MKQLTAAFLLFIMLIVTTDPVVAMHFCGGEFHDLQLYTIEHHDSCCHALPMDTPIDAVAAETSCCATDTPAFPIEETFDNICCEYEVTQVNSDVYQYQQVNNQVPTLRAITLLTGLINWQAMIQLPVIQTINHTLKFPPVGRFLADMDTVSFICVNIN